MLGAALLGALSLAIATAALITSWLVARRQLRLADRSNVLPVVLQAFKETRTPEFSASVEYIRGRLTVEHPATDGYQVLPDAVKAHIRRIGLFLDDIGKLVAHGVVDEYLILGAYGGFIVDSWEVLGPYIRNEASRRGGSAPMPYFEDLAARAEAVPQALVHRRIGLRQLPAPPNPGG